MDTVEELRRRKEALELQEQIRALEKKNERREALAGAAGKAKQIDWAGVVQWFIMWIICFSALMWLLS